MANPLPSLLCGTSSPTANSCSLLRTMPSSPRNSSLHSSPVAASECLFTVCSSASFQLGSEISLCLHVGPQPVWLPLISPVAASLSVGSLGPLSQQQKYLHSTLSCTRLAELPFLESIKGLYLALVWFVDLVILGEFHFVP